MITIRNERPSDYQSVEEITRRAFYNLYIPGCTEHYLVHIMRQHSDFLPELDFVLELDDRIIGNIMYTKARLLGEDGAEKEILTFGPICIAPEYQKMGYGKKLMAHSFAKAQELCYDVIVIFGSPSNYVGQGFQSCKRHNISLENGAYPTAMLVKELRLGVLKGNPWIYCGSPVMQIDEEAARRFDDRLAPMERAYRPSQEEFYILSHSLLQ